MSAQSDRMVQELTRDEAVESIVFDEVIAYCWVDGEDRRVSPIHRSLGPAITYVEGWCDVRDRIEREAARAQADFEEARASSLLHGNGAPPKAHDVDRFEREMAKVTAARTKLTLTGEPPARLLRMVTRIFVEPPTELEHQVARQALDDQFGDDDGEVA